MNNIRHATHKDIPELLPLMSELGYPCSLSLLEQRFKKFIANNGYGVLVALDDIKVIGFVAWSKSDLFVLDKSRFHIEGIVIDEKYRGKGIGKKLMVELEKIAGKTAPCIIDLCSGKRREKDGSHQFYNSLGYKNEGYMAKLYLKKEIE